MPTVSVKLSFTQTEMSFNGFYLGTNPERDFRFNRLCAFLMF